MTRRRSLITLLLSAVLVSGAAVGVSAPAQAESTAVIYGSVKDSSTGYSVKSFKVTLFDADFTYLKETRVNKNGRYQISSPGPGIYHLQFVDARPAYDTKAYAARLDVPVRVVGTSWVQKSVKVHRGGAIGGSVRVRGKRVPHATIRAISDHGQVITVESDKLGQYALGGLANDNYRVFAYDPAKRRVGKSKLVRKVKAREFRAAWFDLRTKASTFTGTLIAGGKPRRGVVTVTAVNKYTGEYWVKNVGGGVLTLRGLTAGPYKLIVPAAGGYPGRTVNLGSLGKGQSRNVSVYLPGHTTPPA